MNSVGVSEQIRTLRRRRMWTQAQLASALGSDPVTVSRWERGASRPRPSAMRRLAALGLRRAPVGQVAFAEDPASRIRRVDRAAAQQLALKRRARRIG